MFDKINKYQHLLNKILILTTTSRDVSLAPDPVSTLDLAAGPDQKVAFVTDNLVMRRHEQ